MDNPLGIPLVKSLDASLDASLDNLLKYLEIESNKVLLEMSGKEKQTDFTKADSYYKSITIDESIIKSLMIMKCGLSKNISCDGIVTEKIIEKSTEKLIEKSTEKIIEKSADIYCFNFGHYVMECICNGKIVLINPKILLLYVNETLNLAQFYCDKDEDKVSKGKSIIRHKIIEEYKGEGVRTLVEGTESEWENVRKEILDLAIDKFNYSKTIIDKINKLIDKLKIISQESKQKDNYQDNNQLINYSNGSLSGLLIIAVSGTLLGLCCIDAEALTIQLETLKEKRIYKNVWGLIKEENKLILKDTITFETIRDMPIMSDHDRMEIGEVLGFFDRMYKYVCKTSNNLKRIFSRRKLDEMIKKGESVDSLDKYLEEKTHNFWKSYMTMKDKTKFISFMDWRRGIIAQKEDEIFMNQDLLEKISCIFKDNFDAFLSIGIYTLNPLIISKIINSIAKTDNEGIVECIGFIILKIIAFTQKYDDCKTEKDDDCDAKSDDSVFDKKCFICSDTFTQTYPDKTMISCHVMHYLIKEIISLCSTDQETLKKEIADWLIDKLTESFDRYITRGDADQDDKNTFSRLLKLAKIDNMDSQTQYILSVIHFMRSILDIKYNKIALLNTIYNKYGITINECGETHNNIVCNGKSIDNEFISQLSKITEYYLGYSHIKNNALYKDRNTINIIVNFITKYYDILKDHDVDGYVWSHYIFYSLNIGPLLSFINRYRTKPYKIRTLYGVVINNHKELLTETILHLDLIRRKYLKADDSKIIQSHDKINILPQYYMLQDDWLDITDKMIDSLIISIMSSYRTLFEEMSFTSDYLNGKAKIQKIEYNHNRFIL